MHLHIKDSHFPSPKPICGEKRQGSFAILFTRRSPVGDETTETSRSRCRYFDVDNKRSRSPPQSPTSNREINLAIAIIFGDIDNEFHHYTCVEGREQRIGKEETKAHAKTYIRGKQNEPKETESKRPTRLLHERTGDETAPSMDGLPVQRTIDRRVML